MRTKNKREDVYVHISTDYISLSCRSLCAGAPELVVYLGDDLIS
jgi:hypothetical protein